MSFARGFIKGFIGQSLDNKAEADRRLGELTDKISLDYLNNKRPAFEKNEDLMLKRYNTIKTELGEPSALYASATGSTETDFATKRLLDLKGDERAAFIDAVSKIDFQNFNRDLGVATRTKNFNERNKEITDTFKKIPGGLPNAVTDLFMPLPEGTMTESTFDATKLPSLASMIPSTTTTDVYNSLDIKAKASIRNTAKSEFNELERDKNTKLFRKNFEKGYDKTKHGPSKEVYAFNRYFNEYYLPELTRSNIPIQTTTTGTTTTQELSREDRIRLAQSAIDQARAMNDPDVVERIKEQLRIDLGETNLSEIIR
jgi:hypothetical protein